MEYSHNTKKVVADCPDFPKVFKFPLIPHKNGAQIRMQMDNILISFQYLRKSTIGEY